jgi:SSS family transporter
MTTALLTLAVVALYVVLLFVVARLSWRGGDNAKFFTGGRNQKWWVVALAMVGAPMTGITFVSVPGMVGASGFSYLQMVLGFVVGSVVIAYLLIPLYYRYNVTSLYEYLDNRFGVQSHSAGAWLFLVSKVVVASLRVFVVCVVIQQLLCNAFGVPFWATAMIFMALVWLYTYRGGVGAVVWTDTLKTLCMVLCVVLCAVFLLRELGISFGKATLQAVDADLTKAFYFDDIDSPLHFAKMFLAGVFMIVAMTGLDQDMMQRALSSRSQRSAQRNMVVASLLQGVVITMLLVLGALLYLYLAKTKLEVAKPDEVFAFVATQEGMPTIISILLVLGVLVATFSATGGALTSLTTSFAVDVLRNKDISTASRKWIHAAMALVLGLLVLAFEQWSSDSTINLVYRLASYTYGPLLGLFAFGVLSKRAVRDRVVPAVVLLAPLFSLVLDLNSEAWFGGYNFGFELLLVNATFTIVGFYLSSLRISANSLS